MKKILGTVSFVLLMYVSSAAQQKYPQMLHQQTTAKTIQDTTKKTPVNRLPEFLQPLADPLYSTYMRAMALSNNIQSYVHKYTSLPVGDGEVRLSPKIIASFNEFRTTEVGVEYADNILLFRAIYNTRDYSYGFNFRLKFEF